MDEFDRITVIGKGSYGEVWLVKHKTDRKQYVLKRINLQRTSKREHTSAEQEARLLQKLRHPNIVSYKHSFETPDGMLFIAMQYCEGGDLYTKLKSQNGVLLQENQVVEWFIQIAMALQYMHERNILHRDLKTQNIFITKSKVIKVGDLGIARVLDGASDMATTLIGTPYYMSPELFSNKPYNHKSDVWALGCCVYEMTTLKHAFNANDMNSLVYRILRGKLPHMPRHYSPQLLTLMRAMLQQDPERRPCVSRLLRDVYVKRHIALFLEDTKRSHSDVRCSDPNISVSAVSQRVALDFKSDSCKSSDIAPGYRDQVLMSKGDHPDCPEGDSGGGGDCPVEETKLGSLQLQGSEADVRKKRKKRHVFSQPMARQLDVKGRSLDDHSASACTTSTSNPLRLSPMPKVEISDGLPERRMSLNVKDVDQFSDGRSTSNSASSKSSSLSDGVAEDIPTSLSCLSARDRRRRERAGNSSVNNLPSTRHVKLRKVPERVDLNTNIDEKALRSSPPAADIKPRTSLQGSDCSHEFLPLDEVTECRENNEMDSFIHLLDSTLRMNCDADHSEGGDIEEVPVISFSPSPENGLQSAGPVSGETLKDGATSELQIPQRELASTMETLSSTSRLMNRIKLLQKDCFHGVGCATVRQAFDILDNMEDEQMEVTVSLCERLLV